MIRSYWQQALSSRIGRRRALASGAVLGAGVALGLACGDDSGDESPANTSGLFAERNDTTKEAVKGGIYQAHRSADVPSLDPTTSVSFLTQVHAGYVYSRLLKFRPGILKPAGGEIDGDLAESWEVLDGGTRLVFKMRSDAGLDARAPTNGRKVDAQDVLFSWGRFSTLHPQRTDIARSASASAPVESLEAPDARTVVVKLAEPFSVILPLLASTQHLWVIPREAESAFDARQDSRGSGPWGLESYQRSVGLEYRRNANWYLKDRPFLDGWSLPIVSEYAQVLAQFRAKNIWSGAVRQEDVLQTKQDIPSLVMLANDTFSTGMEHMMFGYNPGSPFRDERVRQAFSMLVDRDLWIDTFLNLAEFRTAGVDIPNRWHTHIPAGWDGTWIDPKSNALGPNAKYFKHNIAEAKSLLAAAGHKDGFDTTGSFFTSSQYGVDFPKRNEVIFDMVAEGGIRVRRNVIDFTTDYNDKYHRAKGKFDGVSSSAGGARVDPGLWAHTHYHKSGSAVHVDAGSDPEVDRLVELQFREFDAAKRTQILQDLQKHLAKTMALMPMAGVSAGLSLSWPWIGNQGVYRAWPGSTYGGPTESSIHTWIDNSKKL